jgi:hypothetical protein
MKNVAAIFVVTILLTAPVVAQSEGRSIVLAFWAGPGAKKDKRVIDVHDHSSCSGEVAHARVSKMPPPQSKGPLQPELVVELSDSGAVLKRWAMPVDSVVVGVRGNSVLVPLYGGRSNDERALLISSDRSFVVIPRPKVLPSSTAFACPRIPEFGETDYLTCLEFSDLESRNVRRLAFHAPCT